MMTRDRARSSGWSLACVVTATLACLLFVAANTYATGYAGSEACADCHESHAESLALTQHGMAGFEKLSSHGCESCHGPANAHTEDPDDLSARPTSDPDVLSQSCQNCHDGGKQSHWMGSMHESRDVACTDCHSVHSFTSTASQLKQPSVMESCFQCHKDIRAETQKQSHHPIREGKVACNDCHNPHGTTTDKMIIAASVNEQCYECHTEKRGPFLWDHAPVRENCMNCHNAHGSNHPKLQRTSIPYMCQQCHSNTRHPGTLYDATTLPGATRASNREFNRSCVNCHAAVHGTNHPSGPYLGR